MKEKLNNGVWIFLRFWKEKRGATISLLLIVAFLLTSINFIGSVNFGNKVKELPPTFWTKDRYVDSPIFVLESDLEKLSQSMPLIRVEYELEFTDWYWITPPGTKLNQTTICTGVVIDDYILTCGHAVDIGWMLEPYPIKINKREIFLGMSEEAENYKGPRGSLELIWVEDPRTVDLALLKFPEGVEKMPSFPFDLGKTDSKILETGKFVYAAGLPYWGLNVMHLAPGNIASTRTSELLANVYFPESKGNVFSTSADLYSGYSGGPMMAVTTDGKLELVGIVQGTSWTTKIDRALEIVKRKTGIDLMKEWSKSRPKIVSQENWLDKTKRFFSEVDKNLDYLMELGGRK